MTQKKFIAAIDGSELSSKVVDKAIEYSNIFHAEIVFIYCHKNFPVFLRTPYDEEAISSILLEAEKVIKPHIERLEKSGVKFSKRLMEEPPGKMISRVAEVEQCDLIIMGSRGLSNLEGLIVGSTTHRVLHLSSCSVLVVK
jgi:nucleotide-binding universal stress UspA family protein